MKHTIVDAPGQVSESGSLDSFGCKAKGLVEVPQRWGLPFFVISHEFFENCKSAGNRTLEAVVAEWEPAILDGIAKCIPNAPSVILRSSGSKETIVARGQYESYSCNVEDISETLLKLVRDLQGIADIAQDRISILCQEFREPVKRGHLSNERRCCKESRDWLGETEQDAFSIGVRKWRKQLSIEDVIAKSIECHFESQIISQLHNVAYWATERSLRVHFEWVWDGKYIWIVQADREDLDLNYGINPEKIAIVNIPDTSDTMSALVHFSDESNIKYRKLENCHIYKDLGIKTANLYVLDDYAAIHSIASGNFSPDLVNDLQKLCVLPLIIRCDTIEEDKAKRQMLPRTEGITSLESAKKWLTDQARKFISKELGIETIAFVFHNFIPSKSSAFVYAEPSQRDVLIESLWGVPESLYYNSHDKYIVDTGSNEFGLLKEGSYGKFSIQSDIYYKSNFMFAHANGDWKMERLKPSYEWKDSLNYFKGRDIAYEIAYVARKICEEVGEPISIMWFVGVPEVIVESGHMPWHHEPLDHSMSRDVQSGLRKKTFNDCIKIVSSIQDVEELEQNTFSEEKKGILLFRPSEELIREKGYIKRLGAIAKKLKLPIGLEGGILSHAFYQLKNTGAEVEVLATFKVNTGKREFNKLVRDRIPSNISKWGENVNVKKVTDEAYILALKNKLVEETFEVKDAHTKDELMGEIGDVLDIVDSLIKAADIDSKAFQEAREKKIRKSGGFNDGLILTKTVKQNRVEKKEIKDDLFSFAENSYKTLNVAEYTALCERAENSSDMRSVGDMKISLKNIKFPIFCDEQTLETRPIPTSAGREEVKGVLKLKRTDSLLDLTFEIQINEREGYIRLSTDVEDAMDER